MMKTFYIFFYILFMQPENWNKNYELDVLDVEKNHLESSYFHGTTVQYVQFLFYNVSKLKENHWC